jgi:DMSO/TMAO reductase YedYZ molybdopterin-dependent catalytic subunit
MAVQSLRSGAAAGLVGAATLVLGGAVLHTLVRSFPFLPLALAQAVVRAAPGGFATFFIERLGHWAIRLAVVGTLGGFFVGAGLLGLLIPKWSRFLRGPVPAGAASFFPVWAISVAVYPSPAGSLGRWAFAAASFPVAATCGAVAGWSYRRLVEAPASQRMDLSRRYVLRALAWGSLGVLLGVADLGRLILRRPDPGREPLVLPDLMRATSPPASQGDAAFASIAGLTPRVTTNDRFYVVDEEIIDPDIDRDSWNLSVGGLVREAMALTYDQLERMPAVERYQTLECISNDVGGDLISTAKWVGVPLPSILDLAGVGTGAVEVVFRAAGGYTESLPIDQAMDESTLVAIGMNDHVLPRAHGFPARILSLGTFGMKNPKWLTEIEVVDRPYAGYWERRGWSKAAVVKTMSRIDVPRAGSTVAGRGTVAGVAFAGDRGISRVEVSADGGRTWAPAQLETQLSSTTWRRWLFQWNPPGTGEFGILVRAYDGRGAIQTPRRAAPHPSGATGYHALTVRHESG